MVEFTVSPEGIRPFLPLQVGLMVIASGPAGVARLTMVLGDCWLADHTLPRSFSVCLFKPWHCRGSNISASDALDGISASWSATRALASRFADEAGVVIAGSSPRVGAEDGGDGPACLLDHLVPPPSRCCSLLLHLSPSPCQLTIRGPGAEKYGCVTSRFEPVGLFLSLFLPSFPLLIVSGSVDWSAPSLLFRHHFVPTSQNTLDGLVPELFSISRVSHSL